MATPTAWRDTVVTITPISDLAKREFYIAGISVFYLIFIASGGSLKSGVRHGTITFMKLAGFLLLAAGWVIVLAAVALLRPAAPQTCFVLAGVSVEVLGLILVVRSHLVVRGARA
jgi:hypothetical protein